MNVTKEGDGFTDEARQRWTDYLDEVRALAAREPELDADELVADVIAHVDEALRPLPEPVRLADLDAVLAQLAPPAEWLAPASRADETSSTRVATRAKPRVEPAVALTFWGGLALTGTLALPPLLPLLAFLFARRQLARLGPARTRRSPWLAPPLFAGEALAWLLVAGFPALLLLAFATEGSVAANTFAGNSPAVGLSAAAALLIVLVVGVATWCARRPALARRLLPFTAELGARLPRRALTASAVVMAALATVLRLRGV